MYVYIYIHMYMYVHTYVHVVVYICVHVYMTYTHGYNPTMPCSMPQSFDDQRKSIVALSGQETQQTGPGCLYSPPES